jgi:hypothetical protein
VGNSGSECYDLIIAGVTAAGLLFAFTMRHSRTPNSSKEPTIRVVIGNPHHPGCMDGLRHAE